MPNQFRKCSVFTKTTQMNAYQTRGSIDDASGEQMAGRQAAVVEHGQREFQCAACSAIVQNASPATNAWLQPTELNRAPPQVGKCREWHVFIQYRETHRVW